MKKLIVILMLGIASPAFAADFKVSAPDDAGITWARERHNSGLPAVKGERPGEFKDNQDFVDWVFKGIVAAYESQRFDANIRGAISDALAGDFTKIDALRAKK